MSRVAWSVCLCVYLCVEHTRELCKTGEPIGMPFRRMTQVDAGNHVFDEGQDPKG